MSYARYSDLGDNGPKTDQAMIDAVCPKIQNAQHKQQLVQTNRVVCIDVYGDWCGPCKAIAPQFVEMAQKYNRPSKCALVKEDVDMHLSQNIRGVPCFLFFKDGQYVDSVTGADMQAVEGKLLQLLADVQ